MSGIYRGYWATFATVWSLILNIFRFLGSICSSDASMGPCRALVPAFASLGLPREEPVRIRGLMSQDGSASVSLAGTLEGDSPYPTSLPVLTCLVERNWGPLVAIVRLLFNIIRSCELSETLRAAESASGTFKPRKALLLFF